MFDLFLAFLGESYLQDTEANVPRPSAPTIPKTPEAILHVGTGPTSGTAAAH